jgi:hypothetical protein
MSKRPLEENKLIARMAWMRELRGKLTRSRTFLRKEGGSEEDVKETLQMLRGQRSQHPIGVREYFEKSAFKSGGLTSEGLKGDVEALCDLIDKDIQTYTVAQTEKKASIVGEFMKDWQALPFTKALALTREMLEAGLTEEEKVAVMKELEKDDDVLDAEKQRVTEMQRAVAEARAKLKEKRRRLQARKESVEILEKCDEFLRSE